VSSWIVLITTLVLLPPIGWPGQPVNVDAGWGPLTMELNLAASLRTALRDGGDRVAAKGLFHAALADLHEPLDQ